jgi:hypothetical protein
MPVADQGTSIRTMHEHIASFGKVRQHIPETDRKAKDLYRDQEVLATQIQLRKSLLDLLI